LGLPPKARVAYVTRLGAAVSDAGYCWPSIYVPKRLSGPGHENLHRVLAFDCLANRGLMDYGQWFLANYSPGTPESAGFVNNFIKANAPRISRREYLADIALVFCPWSDIAATTVWGTMPEMFLEEYAGWADFLCVTHRQWDVVLSQDITCENLSRYPIVVLPSIMVLTEKQVGELTKYVEGGGRLVATGLSGTRYGPDKYLMPRETNALAALAPYQQVGTGLAGRPNVKITKDKPGLTYRAENRGEVVAQRMNALLSFTGFAPRLMTDAPATVGVNLNIGVSENRTLLSLDLNNYDFDLDADTVSPAKPCTVTIRVPEELRQRDFVSRYVYAGMEKPETPVPLPKESLIYDKKQGTLTLKIPEFQVYAIVYIE
jgi:hypothetical protein